MNIEKQTPLSINDINEINNVAHLRGYYIKQTENYPKNNIHLRVVLPIRTGFDINRNNDSFVLSYVDSVSLQQTENKWVVVANGVDCQLDNFTYNKEFDNVHEAVEYVYSARERIVSEELVKVRTQIEKC